MSKKIGFAIVGYGNIGKRHAGHILDNPQAELLAVCDTKTDFGDEQIAGVKQTTSLEELLELEEVQVVNVCTPNYLHKEMTVKALQANKHVVCEKPMAINTAECEAMISAAEDSLGKIFVVKQNRYNPPVEVVKKLLAEDGLGRVYQANVSCFWNRNEDYYRSSNWRGTLDKDGGCLLTQFSHFVDILYFLLGDVDCLNGQVENMGHKGIIEFEDTGTFELVTKAGTLISFAFTTCSYEKNMEGSITIIGEKGSVKIGGQYLNMMDYQHIDGRELDVQSTGSANEYGSYTGSMSNHDKVIQNVVDTLRGKDVAKASALEGMKVVEIIEKMYTAASR